jgi:hypothetical protein
MPDADPRGSRLRHSGLAYSRRLGCGLVALVVLYVLDGRGVGFLNPAFAAAGLELVGRDRSVFTIW